MYATKHLALAIITTEEPILFFIVDEGVTWYLLLLVIHNNKLLVFSIFSGYPRKWVGSSTSFPPSCAKCFFGCWSFYSIWLQA